MALQGKPVAISNSATTIYTCPSGTEAAVHGLIFANNTGGTLTVDLAFYDQTTATTTTVATDLAVAANSYITWAKPINMNAGDYIQATSSAASGLVCLYSVYEGSAAPVATGFTGRGVWDSGSTYAINDIVTVVGTGTYLALQASTNQNPTSATAYWMFLEGISASALPSQAGQAGKYLTTDGTDASWAVVDVAGGGLITSGASSNISLTSASQRVQKISFDGSGYSVTLPSATSLNKGGALFVIENNGDFSFSVKTVNGLSVSSISAGSLIQVYLVDNSTSDGTWQVNLGTAQGSFATAAVATVDSTVSVTDSNSAQVSDDKFIYAYYSPADNTKLYLRVVDFSSGSPVLGTRTSITLTQSGGTTQPSIGIRKLDTNKAIMTYWQKTGGSSHDAKAVVLTVSGTTISIGSPVTTTSIGVNAWCPGDINIMSPTSVVLTISLWTSNWYQEARALSISGSTITVGSATGGAFSWPGSRSTVESSNAITVWWHSGSNFANLAPFTVSGTTLTAGTSYDNISGIPWNNGPNFNIKDNTVLYLSWSNASNLYVDRVVRDTSFSPSRWSQSTTYGFKRLGASNYINTRFVSKLYSTTGGQDKIAVVNNVTAGLSGSGLALSFFTYDTSTAQMYQSPLSFLIPGDGFSGTIGNSGSLEEALHFNSSGDIYIMYKDLLTSAPCMMRLGSTQV